MQNDSKWHEICSYNLGYGIKMGRTYRTNETFADRKYQRELQKAQKRQEKMLRKRLKRQQNAPIVK